MVQCPVCGMQVNDLEGHKRETHPEMTAGTTTKCPVCGMQVEDLEEHKKDAHPGM